MTWENAWREGRTGWDQGEPAPALVALLQRETLPNTGSALVPGCGAGYDAMALAHYGLHAVGMDLAPTAATRFHQVRGQESLTEQDVEIVIGDFFADTPERAPFQVIWDYTFLCAIEPELREAWATRMHQLCASDGVLVTLIFPVDPEDHTASTADDPGPPYRLHPDVVADLLAPYFERLSLEPAPASAPSRLGKEFLAVWRPKP